MATATQEQATSNLDAHAQSIDDLHRKLAATPGVDQQRLKSAVDKFKQAFHQFRDDALGCMQ